MVAMALISPNHGPTPEEIADLCAEIQLTWSEAERQQRVHFAEYARRANNAIDLDGWSLPKVFLTDFTKRYER
jgi:hypothetical protein